jgi:hypothetical protein
MRIAATSGLPVQRIVALLAAYVLALQALFSGGAQLRVLLSDAPGICTIIGFQDKDAPAHRLDVCAQHCVGHASLDAAGIWALASVLIGTAAWSRISPRPVAPAVRPISGYRGRAPPRL